MRRDRRSEDELWQHKWSLRFSPRVASLNRWVVRLRRRGRLVPWFDPDDGGVHARVLLLLESPGPKVVSTQFISRENADPTARRVAESFDGAGLTRLHLVAWNAIPWARERPSAASIRQAASATVELLDMLPKLRAVVLMGNHAQRAWANVEPLLGSRLLWIHFAPHPAQRAMNQAGLLRRLRAVARRVSRLHG